MHDTDGISSHRRMKNSTLLRSRVEFQIKSFCFFTVYLTGGTSILADAVFFCLVLIQWILFNIRIRKDLFQFFPVHINLISNSFGIEVRQDKLSCLLSAHGKIVAYNLVYINVFSFFSHDHHRFSASELVWILWLLSKRLLFVALPLPPPLRCKRFW